MTFVPPRMMPGQTPYTEEEYRVLQVLLNAAMEEETGGLEVGSWEWIEREKRLDEENDRRKREGR
jgi:hypothetical protein